MHYYWPKENDKNRKDRYRNLPFPYESIDTPTFFATSVYTFDDLLTNLFSWSGVQEYIKQHNENPIEIIYDELRTAWGNLDEKKKISWQLHTKIGKKPLK